MPWVSAFTTWSLLASMAGQVELDALDLDAMLGRGRGRPARTGRGNGSRALEDAADIEAGAAQSSALLDARDLHAELGRLDRRDVAAWAPPTTTRSYPCSLWLPPSLHAARARPSGAAVVGHASRLYGMGAAAGLDGRGARWPPAATGRAGTRHAAEGRAGRTSSQSHGPRPRSWSVGLLLVLAFWCFSIAEPFLVPIVWGMIIAVAVHHGFARPASPPWQPHRPRRHPDHDRACCFAYLAPGHAVAGAGRRRGRDRRSARGGW